jgi:mannose-6-phosphate isomerase-like protein (cupin superfamily)
MIRKSAQMEVEVRNIRNGIGNVSVQHLFKKDEITARTRMCARLTLPPGVSIGMHKHENEDELFIITRGTGLIDDGKTRTPVQAGDATLTGKGEAHAVINNGNEPMEIIAIIMLY